MNIMVFCCCNKYLRELQLMVEKINVIPWNSIITILIILLFIILSITIGICYYHKVSCDYKEFIFRICVGKVNTLADLEEFISKMKGHKLL